ncbi:MAG TPA: hypothetical protein PLB10_15455 [Thiolinea sp.]|nr:hypothetical protein [Thiolinea sp.]
MTQSVKLGLLGNGIGRSRAKNLHELLGTLYGLDISYQPMDMAGRTRPVVIAEELQRCQEEGFRGVNVTHPYKREAFRCITPLPGFPSGLTSANTVLFDDGAMHGGNTDFSGFCRGYRSQFGEDSAAGRVLMLGTGGVGLAIAYGLTRLGATELVLYDKNPETAQVLLEQMQKTGLKVRLAWSDLITEMQEADGLINATPVGMFQYPGSPFPLEGFDKQQWAFDAVYTPEKTEFLQACRARGIATLSGFKLFLYQGLDAFEHFTGIAPDDAQVETEFLSRYPLE